MKLHKGELNHLGLFYLANFTYNTLFILMAFLAFYLKDIGFTFFQIGLLLSLYALVQLIFEIPTGAFADRFGRKTSVILGYVLSGISLSLLGMTQNITTIFIFTVLVAISFTFITGAQTAWVIDNIRKKKNGKLSQIYFIRNQSISNLGLFFSGLIGAFLVKTFGLWIIWPVTAIGAFGSAIILLFIKEHKNSKISLESKFIDQIQSTLKYALKKKPISILLIITLLTATQISFASESMWQLFLENKGLDPYKFGFVFSSVAIIGIFSPYISQTFIKKLGNEKLFLLLTSVFKITVLLYVSTIFSWKIGVLAYILYIILIDTSYPVEQNLYQNYIPSKMRATAGSVQGMLASLGFGIFMPFAGLLADIIGPQMTIVSSFVILVPVIFLYTKLHRH